MPADQLEPILEKADVTSSRIERPELEAISRCVSTGDPAEFLEAVTVAPGLSWNDGQDRPPGYLEIHDRHWWIDVTDAGNRRYLLTVITATVLADVLKLDVSIVWITRVLPELLVLRSVRRDDAGLHLHLERLATKPQLPPHLADIVNPRDFAEFAAAVAGAATILPVPAGGTVTILLWTVTAMPLSSYSPHLTWNTPRSAGTSRRGAGWTTRLAPCSRSARLPANTG